LELVPSEIEKLLLPLPDGIRPQLRKLDDLVRAETVPVVLERQSEVVLGALGLSRAKQEQLLGAWFRLKNRRQRTSAQEMD